MCTIKPQIQMVVDFVERIEDNTQMGLVRVLISIATIVIYGVLAQQVIVLVQVIVVKSTEELHLFLNQNREQ